MKSARGFLTGLGLTGLGLTGLGLTGLGLLAAIGCSTAAFAATTAPPSPSAVVSQALHRFCKVTVLETRPGPPGMTAALVEVNKHKAIVWVLDNGKAVASGNVWDAQGHNRTREMAVEMGLMPRPLSPAKVAADVAQHDTFTIGKSGPELTVFLDPNCIFCHMLYKEAAPLAAQGKLRLRVVMVGFLKPTSFGRAAAILMASDPAKALATDEHGFNTTKEEGGIAPATDIPAKVKKAVVANTNLLAKSGEVATPTLLYRDHAGAWKVMHHGPPGGLADWLGQLKG